MPKSDHITLIVFLTLVFSLLAFLAVQVLRASRKPVREWSPKTGDYFFAEVYTQTAVGGGRTLTMSYHPTEEEARKVAKKNAKWFDAFGNVHRDVGIFWSVGLIQND